MVDGTPETSVRPLQPDRTTVLGVVGVLVVETLFISGYATRPDVYVTNPLVLAYPFVWIDVSLFAVSTTHPPRSTTRRRYVGLVVAGGYLVVLSYLGGLFGPGAGMAPAHVSWSLPPGYGPALLYDGAVVRLVLEPYKLVGYLTLAYLVYVTVLDAAGAAFSGVIGLFSCVSCTWPILGTVAASLFGSTSAFAALALGQAYGLSTLVFLSAVTLLWWRPTV